MIKIYINFILSPSLFYLFITFSGRFRRIPTSVDQLLLGNNFDVCTNSYFCQYNKFNPNRHYVCVCLFGLCFWPCCVCIFLFCFFVFLIEKRISCGNVSINRSRVLFTRPTNFFFFNKTFIWSHSTIHTFKNYFTTVFLVFSKISSIQTDPVITEN